MRCVMMLTAGIVATVTMGTAVAPAAQYPRKLAPPWRNSTKPRKPIPGCRIHPFCKAPDLALGAALGLATGTLSRDPPIIIRRGTRVGKHRVLI
jgi:hypothetical protein